MYTNVTQYATLLVALGCTLNFNTTTGKVEIAEIPRKYKGILLAALGDIAKFDPVSNQTDAIVAMGLAEFMDGKPTLLSKDQRNTLLTSLDIKRADKFVVQTLHKIKHNRSWHKSEEPEVCTAFGDECTNREDVPKRRGRKRVKTTYHESKPRGIASEHLITANLNMAYLAIPEDKLIR